MGIKIKGFDQITAWIVGIAVAGLVITCVWYFGKYEASKDAKEDAKRVAEAEKRLEALSHETKDESIADIDDHRSSLEAMTPGKSIESFENWGYTGNLAPWNWPSLNDKWKSCGKNDGQSPIDISGAKMDEDLKPLKLLYKHGITHLTWHHQTILGDVEPGSYLEWDGERFDLKKIYFRTPSEHRLHGLPWDMEIQLEHTSMGGSTIMVALFAMPGKSSETLNAVGSVLPRIKDEIKDAERINWIDIFPAKKTYWTYFGSMTTPPCQGNIRWIVLEHVLTSDKKFIDSLVLLQKNNVRPTYPLGRRPLLRSNR